MFWFFLFPTILLAASRVDPLQSLLASTQDLVEAHADDVETILETGISNSPSDQDKKAIWLQHTMKLEHVGKVLNNGALVCQYTIFKNTGSNSGSGTDDVNKGLGFYVFTRLPFGKFDAASYALDKTRAMWFIDGEILKDRYFWAFKGDAGKTVGRVPPKQNPAATDFDPNADLAALQQLIASPATLNEVCILGDIPLSYVRALVVAPEGERLITAKMKQKLDANKIIVKVQAPRDNKLAQSWIPDAGARVGLKKSNAEEESVRNTITDSEFPLMPAIISGVSIILILSTVYYGMRRKENTDDYTVLMDEASEI